MTEAEWLGSKDPVPMLQFVSEQASPRKMRLYGCACVRCVWHLLTEGACRRLVETTERYVEGQADDAELERARVNAQTALWNPLWRQGEQTKQARRERATAAAALGVTTGRIDRHWGYEENVLGVVRNICEALGGEVAGEKVVQAALLREVIGNPFRPTTVDPDWLTWNDGTALRIAQTIYDDRRFDELPILGDALEEAGCIDAELLRHCRGPNRHVRGCWVVDGILGKE